MNRASGAASRAAAARTADDLMAQRAAQLQEHEKEVHRLVTDYYQATAQVANIRADAQARATKLTADAQTRIAALNEQAQKEASAFEDAATAAARAIPQSGEPPQAVAHLTGLSLTQLRVIQRAAEPAAHPRRAPNREHASDSDARSPRQQHHDQR